MEYGIRQLAALAGVSARTLRYYHQIGLLPPARVGENGYRYYGPAQVDLLQQILFYRQRGFELEAVRALVYQPGFDRLAALQEHLARLTAQRDGLDALIRTVNNTIASMKGEIEMSDEQKFAAFKQNLVAQNEAQYGAEVRAKYGDPAADAANQALLNMTEAEYRHFKELEENILQALRQAVAAGADPAGEAGRAVAALHAEWLRMSWHKYQPAMHLGLVDLYLADERFAAYYNGGCPGCAEFLNRAVHHWVRAE